MSNKTPLTQLKGIGEKTAKLFEKLEIHTAQDLLRYYPKDYELFEEPTPIAQAVCGKSSAVKARLVSILADRRVKNLHLLMVSVSDGTGQMKLTFFNMPYLKKTLKPGSVYVFRGMVSSKGDSLAMEQPKVFSVAEYEKLQDALVPKYALTKGLTNHTIQKAVRQAFSVSEPTEEYLPESVLQDLELMQDRDALLSIHFPVDFDTLVKARKRIVFHEFFDFILQMKLQSRVCEKTPNHFQVFETADTVRFLESLPFPLTKAQRRVWQEIRDDLGGKTCMNRLIQGDVGSGKTILAFLALLMTAANGHQGALMAPTEVLAMQHMETVTEYIEKYHLAFRPVLLVGSMTAKQKKEAYAKIESGEANLVIGTHALIQDKVHFPSLALVVTDEQHRFGVRQREMLVQKGSMPHVLVMSATPIPRTLAIILYGDLKISVVDELPANRLPIKNCVVNTSYRPRAYRFIADEVAKGRQVYVICPQVEDGEMDDLENVCDYTEKLRQALPEHIRVAYLHGKMRPADKNRIMDEYASHAIDVLVSTTVIEVGINVPNATVMMVENAERFGLAQLHQLRGRVGRGEHQSYCIFVSTKDTPETMQRLSILNQSNDGFHIAAQDLKLRGPGDLFGIRQSGAFSFRMGDVFSDAQVFLLAANTVDHLLAKDPDLHLPEHAKLRAHIIAQNDMKVDFRTI